MPKRKVRVNPVPSPVIEMNDYRWRTWFSELRSRVGEGPFQIQGYSSSSLPDPTEWGSVSPDDPFSSLIFVWDGAGPTIAFSDGTNWINLIDGSTL